MNKADILNELNELTSFMSFGRILSKIILVESVGIRNQVQRSQMSNEERLMRTEIDFLAGLWLFNVDINKSLSYAEDENIIKKTKYLMNELHLTYKPVKGLPLNKQLVEVCFYEGDEAYDWQLIEMIHQKYNNDVIDTYLKRNHSYDSKRIKSLFHKIKSKLQEQIEENLSTSKHSNNPMPLFTLTPLVVERIFTSEERAIIKSFSFKLGRDSAKCMNEISDINTFLLYPIIELPDEKGYFFIDMLALAISLNVTPYYWLRESNEINNKKLGTIRGKISEQMVYNIIKNNFKEECIFRDIIIKGQKKSKEITDIDLLVLWENVGLVFQIKSKGLTELSKQGDFDAINRDLDAAYNQGEKCITCLKEKAKYPSLNQLPDMNDFELINICITTEIFPSISTLSFIKSYDLKETIIAMSIYDLKSIFDLLNTSEICLYFRFRIICVIRSIYGINEMYYLGAFIIMLLRNDDGFPKQIILKKNNACLIDYLIKHKNQGNKNLRGLKEIKLFLEKHPFKYI